MKVSVVMAVYNGEKYLEEQMDSIRLQSMQVNEVIICDDISSDASVECIEKYISKHDLQASWHLFENEKNLGYAGNFYAGLKRATGDIIFFCDQDDIWVTDRVEQMCGVMEKNPKIQMLGSEFEPFACTEDAPQISKAVLDSFINDGTLEYIPFNAKNVFIGSEGCTMCIRQSFFKRIESYWFEGWAHDEYVWKMALCLDGAYILHRTTLRRRMHSNNVSKRKMHKLSVRIEFLKKLVKSHEQTLKFAEDINAAENRINILKKNCVATRLRVELLENKRYINSVRLLKYIDCYHSKKSIPVEFMMAVKGKSE